MRTSPRSPSSSGPPPFFPVGPRAKWHPTNPPRKQPPPPVRTAIQQPQRSRRGRPPGPGLRLPGRLVVRLRTVWCLSSRTPALARLRTVWGARLHSTRSVEQLQLQLRLDSVGRAAAGLRTVWCPSLASSRPICRGVGPSGDGSAPRQIRVSRGAGSGPSGRTHPPGSRPRLALEKGVRPGRGPRRLPPFFYHTRPEKPSCLKRGRGGDSPVYN